ncbi:MAG: HEPN domain-containing protein [Euryarchaeota archaeon]|nr:HEPN domain-containing protein [Euryarchaeota archaeon]
MKPEVRDLLTKSGRSLDAARSLYRRGDYDFAVSRAYYAMFYLAQAVLLTRGVSRSKHSGVIAAFGEYFVKTGVLPKEFHTSLNLAFEKRGVGDYVYASRISRAEAAAVLKDAREFVKSVEAYLRKEE